ncbi:hypothetical protein ACROYT_G033754 [Oculina patagonica]
MLRVLHSDKEETRVSTDSIHSYKDHSKCVLRNKMNLKLLLIVSSILLGVYTVSARPSERGMKVLDHLQLLSDVAIQSEVSDSIKHDEARNTKREPQPRCSPGQYGCFNKG